jgi:hypothetical protein
MNISEATRRDIFDSIVIENVPWNGRLEEPDFLARLFDLKSMPSTDSRFPDAYGDIWQHRINNYDWDDYWSLQTPDLIFFMVRMKCFSDFYVKHSILL